MTEMAEITASLRQTCMHILHVLATFFGGAWFLRAFLPNVVATLVGVIGGVPAGLWLNSRAVRSSERQRLVDDQRRFEQMTAALLSAIQLNEQALKTTIETYSADRTPIAINLDVATWDVCRDDVVRLIDGAEVRRMIAVYFEQLRAFVRLADLYRDSIIGVLSALGVVEKTRPVLKQTLIEQGEGLRRAGATIRVVLDGLSKHRPLTRGNTNGSEANRLTPNLTP